MGTKSSAFLMVLWATTVETARAGLAGVRIKQGAEGTESAVRRVYVLRGMFLYAFLLRLTGPTYFNSRIFLFKILDPGRFLRYPQ